MPGDVRAAVLCPPVYDTIYGAPFFGLARWLARLGAQVDVVTPWAIHADIPPSFPEAPTARDSPTGPTRSRSSLPRDRWIDTT